MQVLYKSSQIRNTITELLRTSTGRRVVVVAFVGSDSEMYLPKPQGIELVCWPQPGSTNPNAIREFIGRGVAVSFAPLVHGKLYWTSDKGAVITSANLSKAAFGPSGQIEFGVFVEPGKVDINKVLQQIKARPASSKDLRNLEQAHHEHIKRNPSDTIRSARARDFNDWFRTEASIREQWKWLTFEYSGIKLSTTAKSLLKTEYGNTQCHSWISANRGDYQRNEWLLCLEEAPKRLGRVSWMFAHHVLRVPRSERKKLNDGFESQVLQVGPLNRYEQPPFSVAIGPVQRAIKNAYREAPPKGAKPSNRFINAIHRHYNELRKSNS